MQKLVGIIAEYNPFHNGHKYQIEKTRELLGQDILIVAVMSGSFVQRGEMAVCSKWKRASMALNNGIDLIAELPVEYSLSSANIFARAGVHILDCLGADYISFGSESGDISKLQKIAECSLNAESSPEIVELLKKGISYPNALQSAVSKIYGDEASELLNSANNLLGIEYLKAIKTLNSSMTAVTVKRDQAEHDSECVGDTISSASYIRTQLFDGNIVNIADLERYLPKMSYELLADTYPLTSSALLERLIFSKIRQMTPQQLSAIADVSEGLENRIYEVCITAKNINELYSAIKSKRYTHARIRRIIHNAYLDITTEMQTILPKYAHILGATHKGFEILSRIKQNPSAKASDFIIDSKFSRLYENGSKDNNTLRSLNTNILSTDTFAVCEPVIATSRQDFTEKFIIA